jgi:hypothetical protein
MCFAIVKNLLTPNIKDHQPRDVTMGKRLYFYIVKYLSFHNNFFALIYFLM